MFTLWTVGIALAGHLTKPRKALHARRTVFGSQTSHTANIAGAAEAFGTIGIRITKDWPLNYFVRTGKQAKQNQATRT